MLQQSQKELILTSEYSVVVLGKGSDFVLLRCSGDDASDIAEARDAAQRGMAFFGVLAYRDGEAVADITPDNIGAVYVMLHAGLAFSLLVCDRLKRQQTDDFLRFAEGLHSLNDTRD